MKQRKIVTKRGLRVKGNPTHIQTKQLRTVLDLLERGSANEREQAAFRLKYFQLTEEEQKSIVARVCRVLRRSDNTEGTIQHLVEALEYVGARNLQSANALRNRLSGNASEEIKQNDTKSLRRIIAISKEIEYTLINRMQTEPNEKIRIHIINALEKIGTQSSLNAVNLLIDNLLIDRPRADDALFSTLLNTRTTLQRRTRF